jgi:16S rRNA (adenine(1408)-N(1))-methyltransferase
MESIQGKAALWMDKLALAERVAGYDRIHLDIGTGDGRYVAHIAQANPRLFVIGIDACRENLREQSRRTPLNTLYVIANALTLPSELHGLAMQVTINFPWGSLLEGLLSGDSGLMNGLEAAMHPSAALDILLNAGALAEAGWSLEDGGVRAREVLAAYGFNMRPPVQLTAAELKSCPTTWAKRLAFGRDPRALHLHGTGAADFVSRIA